MRGRFIELTEAPFISSQAHRPPPLPTSRQGVGRLLSVMLRTSPAQPMIEVENQDLLASQSALRTLAQKPLSGVHSLQLKRTLSEVEERLARLQELQQDLMSRDDMDEPQEEWQQVLNDTAEIEEEPLPEEAVEGIEVSASTLMALDWLIGCDCDEE